MRILVDASIEHAELFAPLGDLGTFPARGLSPAALADAQALIIRSTSRLDESLIAAAPRLVFVGTLTSGTDHIDSAALARRGITLADAAGCNSRAVAEYVIAAILHLAEKRGFEPAEKTLGIVGLGRIGSLVAEFAAALHMPIIACDPPLEARIADCELRIANGPRVRFLPPGELLAAADIVSVHVPLTSSGQHPTCGLIGSDAFAGMGTSAILINTSRGEILDETASLEFANRNPQTALILDVWRNEPQVNRELLNAATIATPHLAGQTADARLRAAEMVRDALAAHCGAGPAASPAATSGQNVPVAPREGADPSGWRDLSGLIIETVGILHRSAELKAAPSRFDAIRGAAAQRREFPALAISGRLPPRAEKLAGILGFRI